MDSPAALSPQLMDRLNKSRPASGVCAPMVLNGETENKIRFLYISMYFKFISHSYKV